MAWKQAGEGWHFASLIQTQWAKPDTCFRPQWVLRSPKKVQGIRESKKKMSRLEKRQGGKMVKLTGFINVSINKRKKTTKLLIN